MRLLLLVFLFLSLSMSYTQGRFDKKKFVKRKIEGVYVGLIRSTSGNYYVNLVALRFYKNGFVTAKWISKKREDLSGLNDELDLKADHADIAKGTFYHPADNAVSIQFARETNFGHNFGGSYKKTDSDTGPMKMKLDVNLHVRRKKSDGDYYVELERVEGLAGDSLPEMASILDKNVDDLIRDKQYDQVVLYYNEKGLQEFKNGQYSEALETFDKALEFEKNVKDPSSKAAILNNIGVVHDQMHNRRLAIQNFEEAGKLYLSVDDKVNAARVINQIAIVENEHLNLDKEENALNRVISLEKETQSDKELNKTYNNLSINMSKQKNYDMALELIEKLLQLEITDENIVDIAKAYNNKGNIKLEQLEVIEAISNYKKSLNLKNQIGDVKSTAISQYNLGKAFFVQDELDSAKYFYEKSLANGKLADDFQIINANYRALAEVIAKKGGCVESFEYMKLYSELRFNIKEKEDLMLMYESSEKYLDEQLKLTTELSSNVKLLQRERDNQIHSINLLEEKIRIQKALAQQEKKEAEFNMQILDQEKQLLAQENDLMQSQASRKNWILGGAAASGVLLLSLFLLAIRSRNKEKKDKLKIDQQKQEIAEKNKEFIDSVTYAKRLQDAILPSEKALKSLLPEHFILFKPKDIVSGDFYWMEETEKYIFIAAADCTGHGVPGAMVSVVCSNALSQVVHEYNKLETGEILNGVRDIVIKTFSKSGEEVKDGMDITLLRIDKNSDKIQFSGAHNSLYVYETLKPEGKENPKIPSTDKHQLTEYKTDKMPVGFMGNMDAFQSQEIEVNAQSVLFMISDGYADQFGGDKGKKYKIKNLKQRFLEIGHLPCNEQRQKLDEEFESWKGSFEQVDDVCIIGVRI